jgi:hypothetical protein
MRRMLPRLLMGAVLLVVPSACTGVIGDGVSGANGTPVDGIRPGGAGSNGTAGSATGGGGLGGAAATAEDSGIKVMRRLNHADYNNTVRDLLGTSLRPADKLPDDETAEGFDTVGEVLSLSLSHLETLEQAAGLLIDELYALPATDARRKAVLVCQLQAGSEPSCARQILSGFARRAFRRPVSEAEITGLLQLVEKVRAAGESYEGGVKAALRSILISPNFLYMVEKAPMGAGVVTPVNDHELATRLSYFLWSSMPDAALFAAAEAGALTSDAAKLAAEARRMLEDPKAEALTQDFVGQWLTLRRLELVEPDPKTFPKYDRALRDAAVRETQLFLQALFKENAPAETLLTASYTFANKRLSDHYGLSVTGSDFQRVDLGQTQRLGLLSQASFLMQTSHPAYTSPTKRGIWVLEQLLCSTPPPFPMDMDIPPLATPVENETLRQKLEKHREAAACAGCHAVMDPIGLGLENFDAIGGYRTTENGKAVDATGVLNGTTFSGVRELAPLLDKAKLQTCFAQQLLTYAVGRTFSSAGGQSYADALVQGASAAGHQGMRDVIEAVVQSEAFRTRRAP